MENLTLKQKKVFDFIQQRIVQDSFAPTIREIAHQFKFSSTGTVRDYLKALVKKGYIEIDSNKSRAIELKFKPRIPILGRVAAGSPILAQEDILGYLDFNEFSALSKKDIFALRVKGDSMIGKGIMDSDTVIVQKVSHAQNGDVVVALLQDEATVKTFLKKNNKIFLVPANKKYKPIVCNEETSIIGKVIGVLRKYV